MEKITKPISKKSKEIRRKGKVEDAKRAGIKNEKILSKSRNLILYHSKLTSFNSQQNSS